jgi:hypothetical protein
VRRRARTSLAALVGVFLTGLSGTSLASAPVPAVRGEASVSFPIALPAGTPERITALARTAGHGGARAAAVRALTPPASGSAAVEEWARRSGFQVVHSSPWLVEVRGPADDLARALGTGLSRGSGHHPFATGALHVPAALAGRVMTPIGLDERPRYRHRTFGGGDVQVMHDLPVRGGGAGADVTVGTLNLSGWHPSDLTEYAAAFGLRAPLVQSVAVGSGHVLATAGDDTDGGQGEVALDVEAIAGTAPSARQRMYFGGNSDADYVAILSAMADDAAAGLLQTASTSWGLCEAFVSDSERLAEGAQIDRMVAAGATFFAASGDSGSYGCSTPSAPDTTPAVDWPASQPSTVGVGGTHVDGDAVTGYAAPTAWSLSGGAGAYAGSASGGGCSAVAAEPAYQLAMPAQATEPSCWTGTGPHVRAVPDMAALADPNTGYAVYDSVDGWVPVGGTSLAAPLSAAGLAVYLSSQADKHGVGNILSVAYQHQEAFTDVTSGSNGQWSAQTGYDLVTGLGVPNWRLLGAAIRGIAADPAHPAASAPFFIAPPAWNSLDVPFGTLYNGGRVDTRAIRQDSSHSCSVGSPLVIDGANGTFRLHPVADGLVTVTLTGTDPGMGCRATTRGLFLDRQVPNAVPAVAAVGTTTPRFILSWSFTDVAPSSGSDGFTVKVTDTTTGAVRLKLPWTTTRSATLTGTAGHRYVLAVRSWDRAGNMSPLRSTAFAQYNDASAKLSTGWTRVASTADFGRSHIQTNVAGRTFSFRFTGKTLTAGVPKGRYGGYADVYVDGVKKARISLYATSTKYRQPVRLATFATSGTHTVVVRVAGAHQSGSLGNYVYLDSLTVL